MSKFSRINNPLLSVFLRDVFNNKSEGVKHIGQLGDQNIYNLFKVLLLRVDNLTKGQ